MFATSTGPVAISPYKPDEQREAILLIGALGVSYGEAATTCGVPVGTMERRVSRARATLKTMLEF